MFIRGGSETSAVRRLDETHRLIRVAINEALPGGGGGRGGLPCRSSEF